jgi:hypothetical protein
MALELQRHVQGEALVGIVEVRVDELERLLQAALPATIGGRRALSR